MKQKSTLSPMSTIKVGDFGDLKEFENEKNNLVKTLGEHTYDNVLREIGKNKIYSHLNNIQYVHQPKLL